MGRSTRFILAFLIAILAAQGAALGVSADSLADARVSEDEITVDAGTTATAKFAEGVTGIAFLWVNSVAEWSYHHQLIASTVLVNLPWVVLGLALLYYGTMAVLVLYTSYQEYKARQRERSREWVMESQ